MVVGCGHFFPAFFLGHQKPPAWLFSAFWRTRSQGQAAKVMMIRRVDFDECTRPGDVKIAIENGPFICS